MRLSFLSDSQHLPLGSLRLRSVLLMKAVGTLGVASYFSSTSFACTHRHTQLAYFPGSFPSGWVWNSVVRERQITIETNTTSTATHTNAHRQMCTIVNTHRRIYTQTRSQICRKAVLSYFGSALSLSYFILKWLL